MANKNTRQLRKRISHASGRGESSVEHQTPVRDYHNDAKIRLVNKVFPTAVVNADGVNSVNKRRNSCQRLYVNTGNDKRSLSITRHEPHVKHESMGYPNHKYLEYRKINLG
jgi:hypothetical protein